MAESGRKSGRWWRWLAPTLVLAVAVAGVILALRPHSSNDAAADDAHAAPTASAAAEPTVDTDARRVAHDPYALGKVDAPVVLVEYADFQCPFCGKFARDTQPSLVREYVRTGVLRIEWRNFPIFGAASVRAARAAVAAGRQGRFWQFHEAVYATPHDPGDGYLTDARLRELARDAGVRDLARFDRDRGGNAASASVRRDFRAGQRIGIPSTPAFVIDGHPVLGAQPLTQFRQLIEAAR